MEIKIPYDQRSNKGTLYMGIGWMIIGLISFLFFDGDQGFWFPLGIVYVVIYFILKYVIFITITPNEFIKNYIIYRKKISFSHVKKVKYFAGEYIFKTAKKEMTINRESLNPEQLEQLKDHIYKIEERL